MKVTIKKIIFFILHVLFSAIMPLVLVIYQYSNIGNTKTAVGFKLSITGALLILFVFWIIKKLFIDKKLANLNGESNVMAANLKTKQDTAELRALERELKKNRTIEVFFNSIFPILFLLIAIIAFKALEAQLVKLSATLGLITVSFFIGLVFNILCAREVYAKERKKNKRRKKNTGDE